VGMCIQPSAILAISDAARVRMAALGTNSDPFGIALSGANSVCR
jgi:hypothetical protein